ncbi:MAG: hypothetical protein LIP05_16185 [Tannerellaceae bacterium]|nr:hypothetical protein [Tannerellaceae bacterium]
MSCRVNYTEAKTKTVIQGSGGEEDLIECDFKIKKRAVMQKVYWNGELKWERPEHVSDDAPITPEFDVVR